MNGTPSHPPNMGADVTDTLRVGSTIVLGRRIACVSGGRGDRDVLFLHGFGADRATWMFALPVVASDARVHAIDLPGHGASDSDVGSGDIPFLARVVANYLDVVGIRRLYVVGHSLGGALGLELARARPEVVAGMTLIAPVGFGETINRDFIDVLPDLTDAAAARRTLSLLVARPALISDRMVEDVLAYVARPGISQALRTIVAAVFPAGRQRYRYEAVAQTLDCPVEIVWGMEDRILAPPPRHGVPVPIRTVTNAGHMAHVEKPQAVNRMICDAVGVRT